MEAQLSEAIRSEPAFLDWLAGGGLRDVDALVLWDARLTDASARALAGDPDNHLHGLDLSWNEIGPAGAAALARLPDLRRLRLYHNQAGLAGAEAIASAGGALEALNLCGNALHDAGLAALAIGSLGNLRELALGWNTIGASGVDALLASAWPHLEFLNLRCNELSGTTSARLLSGALPALRRLGVDENPLGDSGLAALVAAPGFAQLEWLNLGGTGLDDEAIAAHWPFDRPLALRKLRLHDNDLSPVTIDRLVRALPACVVSA